MLPSEPATAADFVTNYGVAPDVAADLARQANLVANHRGAGIAAAPQGVALAAPSARPAAAAAAAGAAPLPQVSARAAYEQLIADRASGKINDAAWNASGRRARRPWRTRSPVGRAMPPPLRSRLRTGSRFPTLRARTMQRRSTRWSRNISLHRLRLWTTDSRRTTSPPTRTSRRTWPSRTPRTLRACRRRWSSWSPRICTPRRFRVRRRVRKPGRRDSIPKWHEPRSSWMATFRPALP